MGSSFLGLAPLFVACSLLPGLAGAAGLDVDDPTPRAARLELLPSGLVLEGDFAVSAGSGVLSFPSSEGMRFLEAVNRGNATGVAAPLEVRVDLATRASRASVAGSLESDPDATFQFVDDVVYDTASHALAGSTPPEYCSSVEEFIGQCGSGGFFDGEFWCPALASVFPPGTLLAFDAGGLPAVTTSCSFVAGSAYDPETGHTKLVGLHAVASTGSDGGGPPIFSFVVFFTAPEVLLLEAASPEPVVPALSPRGGFALVAVFATAGAILLGTRRPTLVL